MYKLATLGPKGTYSDAASLKYIGPRDESYVIEYFSSIKKVLHSVGNQCDLAVLPIENFSEGFVSLVLDHLIESDLKIVSEIVLPIQFSFVTHVTDISTVDRLFVQFVAKGQCSEYAETLGDIDIVSTESNIESLNMVMNNLERCAAIVPSASFERDVFSTVVENVNDYKNNQTRFLALSNGQQSIETQASTHWKTSLSDP
ncbi:prephenate dehydratase domain-containing protein [Vibrio sp. PP-XX7]